MTRSLVALVALAGLALAGCPPARGPETAANRGRDAHESDAPTAFADEERLVLSRVAVTDGRLVRRVGLPPSDKDTDLAAMSIIRGESADAMVVDGTLDPFSFDARKKVLVSAKDLAARLPDAAPTQLEKLLLARLIDEELSRVDEERALPASASALIDAMAGAVVSPAGGNDAGEHGKRDVWLARRLDEIGASYKDHPLPAQLRAELDDALDPLEKKAAGYPATVAAVSRLRDQLEDTHARSPAPLTSDGNEIVSVFRAHVDARPTTLPALNQDAEGLVARLNTALRDREIKLTDGAVRRIEARAGKALLADGPCMLAAESGRVRGMQASREREGVCRMVSLLCDTDANDDDAVLVAWLVMRDVAAMSRWVTAPAKSRPSHPFSSTVEMADARRLERGVISRPAAAIGAMKAAALLFSGESFRAAQDRARAWQKLGDAPLDIVEPRLGERPPPPPQK